MPGPRTPTPWFWYIPSALLVCVACVQLWLSHTTGLSPWAGGGFGMFSSIDTRGNRHLHAFALRPGIRRELDIPRSLATDIQHVLIFPTASTLQSLAAELAQVPTPDAGPLEAIELQVWATHYAPDNLQPSSELLRAVTVRMDSLGTSPSPARAPLVPPSPWQGEG
jgi:hypothetical protein